MATKKIREYDSKRLFNHQLKRLSGIELHIRSAHPLRWFIAPFFCWENKRFIATRSSIFPLSDLSYEYSTMYLNYGLVFVTHFEIFGFFYESFFLFRFLPFFSLDWITESTDISELAASEPWLSSEKLAVKPDMLFRKCGKSGVVGLNLHLDRVASFVKDRIGKEVQTLFVPCEASFTSNYCASLIATLPPEITACEGKD